MENKLDFEKIRPKLGEWADDLKPIFETEEMYNLYQEFKDLTDRRQRITPLSKDLYRFLETVPPKNLKLIILGMD